MAAADYSQEFTIGDWAIEPSAGLIRRGDESRHLEPKVMDLLVYLAQVGL